ncbi:MAG: hypothetical protein BWY21_01958 [Parcubacteria group bacterium ADurb.Bin216]|nr:MAG: hypothetical protein BWY21_01958 [Parcubacteria group bacterium ADurb.Bin216]
MDLSTRLDNFDPAQDASIVDLYSIKADKTYVDASLGAKVNQTLFDTSIASLTGWNISQDASLILKADKTYVDGSLNAKQDIIPAGTYVKEASLGDGLVWNAGQLDVSVAGGSGASSLSGLSDVSISSLSDKDALIYDSSNAKWINVPTTDISSLYYERIYIDGSLNAKVNRTLFDSSLLSITNNNLSQDASIIALRTANTNQDTSIALLNGWQVSQDASIITLRATNVTQDASITSLRGWELSQDASILLRPLTTYVDGSLNLKMNIIDVSTTYLKINDASSNYAKRLTYFTTVNASTYLVNPSDNLNIIQCDTSTVITFPDTLEAGFSTTVMLNVSTGYVTLNASTFRATDASVRLKDMYAAATVVHQGSGVFYGFGNLK